MHSIVHWSPSDIGSYWIHLRQYKYKPSTRDWFWNSRLSLCICRCLPSAFWCPLPLGNPIRCPYKTWAFGWWFCRCVREVTHKWHPNSSAQIQSHRPNSKTLENALVCWSIAVSWFLRINTVCSKQSSKTCSGSGRLKKSWALINIINIWSGMHFSNISVEKAGAVATECTSSCGRGERFPFSFKENRKQKSQGAFGSCHYPSFAGSWPLETSRQCRLCKVAWRRPIWTTLDWNTAGAASCNWKTSYSAVWMNIPNCEAAVQKLRAFWEP